MTTMWGKMYDVRAPYNVRAGEISCLRVVKGFSVESWQKDTITDCPPSAGSTRPRCPQPTLFRRVKEKHFKKVSTSISSFIYIYL